MKNTITNMLGTLPPQFFTVTISTVGENMSQLMLSVMMTGYLFRNAQYRLELRNALGGASIRSGAGGSAATVQQSSVLQRSQSAPEQGSVLDEEAYAPGVQKSRVQVREPYWWRGARAGGGGACAGGCCLCNVWRQPCMLRCADERMLDLVHTGHNSVLVRILRCACRLHGIVEQLRSLRALGVSAQRAGTGDWFC
jgi:hypothetical protein